jgi:phosphoglycolate phosphatase
VTDAGVPGPLILVCWDVDGTLIDAAGVDKQVWLDVCTRLTGLPARKPDGTSGRTDPEILLAILLTTGVSVGRARRLLPEAMRRVPLELAVRGGELATRGRALPGAREALHALSDRSEVAQTVVTGNSRAGAELKLATFGLSDHLDLDVGAYGSDPHEDRTQLVRLALQRARRQGPPSAVVVGDSPRDVRAARAAGARCVAIATGRTAFADLRAVGADAVLPDLTDTEAVVAAVLNDPAGLEKSSPKMS